MQRNHRSLLRTLQHLTSDGWRARQRRLWLCLSGLLLGALALWFRAPLPGAAAAQADDVWQPLGEQTRGLANQRAGLPRQYRAFRLNQSALDGLLRQAPAEKKGRLEDSPAVLQLPLPSGKLQRFQLEESSVLEPAQAALYPQLKSYRGRGLDDERATVRFSVTPRGLHALLLTADTVVSIQPATPGQTEIYASYYGRDVSEQERRFECGVSEFVGTERAANRALAPNDFAVGATLRTYRIAIATTQEYSNDFILGGGTLASFDMAGGKAAAFRLANALEIIKISNNLGDAKSLVTHPATTTHQRLTPEARAALGIGDGLLRLSVGLEDADDLIDDLARGLWAAARA